MNAAEFNQLDYHHQTEAVLKGTFLVNRLTKKHYVHLYYLYNFYIEVFYDNRSHLITEFSAFEQSVMALPYLENLKIAV